MRSQARILVGTLAVAALWEAGSRIVPAVAGMETFRVRTVDIRGLRFLSRSRALSDLDLSPRTTIWVNTDTLARRLEADPLVRSARVRREIPSTLVVEVTERRPIAFVPTPTLVPVDAEGVRLPIDPTRHALDLPVMEPPTTPARGARQLPPPGQKLAAEVGRLFEADTAFRRMVSTVSERKDHTVVVQWSDPPVDFLLGLDTPPERLREGLTALADALARDPDHPPTAIDLRYADQVVVRRSS